MKGNNIVSRKKTLEELKNAYKGLISNYKYINKKYKNGEEIIDSAEWLLDNIYLIEKEYKVIKNNINTEYFNNLPADEEFREYPRIYKFALKHVNDAKCEINIEELERIILKSDKKFNIAEIWSLPIMLRITLIITLGIVVNNIAVIEKQRESGKKLAEFIIKEIERKKEIKSIVEYIEGKFRVSENIEKENEINYQGDSYSLHDGFFSEEFVETTIRILKDNSIEDEGLNSFILSRLKKDDEYEIRTREFCKDVIIKNDIGNIIQSLRAIESTNWRKFFEEVSVVENILDEDPADVYCKMDFDSKETYRKKIESLGRKSKISEEDLGNRIIAKCKNGSSLKERHVGYYLVGKGVRKLERDLGIRVEKYEKISPKLYVFLLFIALLVIEGAVVGISYLGDRSLKKSILIFFITFIPLSEAIISLFNWNVSKVVLPRKLPKLSFSDGVPNNCKTVLVIPTLLSSKEAVKKLYERLEVFYLSNKDDNIYFAVLGDLLDSKNQIEDSDNEINRMGIEAAKELNDKYFFRDESHFYFFNRERRYNSREKVYMGYERKRGKIMEFIKLLKGQETSYNVVSPNINPLSKCKYIITLDLDTFIPLGEAKRLIGTIAHPLNQVEIKDGKIIGGYSIIQPKIGISLESSMKSYFSRVFAGDVSIDGYSTAYSDVYQDLFGRGIFTGKGIIDIEGFYTGLNEKIPENLVLSHDLLEGEYTRCGLATDITLLDEYPSTYEGSCKRLKRWVRGDWQLLRWLFTRDLDFLGKYKIFDNLRRSLVGPTLWIGILLAVGKLNGNMLISTLLLLTVMVPLLFTIADFVVTPKKKLIGTFKNFKQLVLILSFIPYQGYIMVQSIVKSLYRVVISRRKLLEWQSAEAVERSTRNEMYLSYKRMWIAPVSAILLLFMTFSQSIYIGLGTILLVMLWAFSPAVAYIISITDREESNIVKLDEEEKILLRDLSRRILFYYEDFLNKENNYLPPDNYQVDPDKGVANRTSPTNIGMGFMSEIVGYHLGYYTMFQVVENTSLMLNEIGSLEKYNGHLLNWYDTKTKMPLWPKYISTVDSGNLLSYLLIIKEELKSYKEGPIVRKVEIESLNDIYRMANIEKVDYEKFDLSNYYHILQENLERVQLLKEDKDSNLKLLSRIENEISLKIDWYNFVFSGIEKFIIRDSIDFQDISLSKLIFKLEELRESSGVEIESLLAQKIKSLNIFLENLDRVIEDIDELANGMDFKFLYSNSRGLFSIGYNLEENKLTNSYYDLMASEARTTSFIAIAKNIVPKEHWYNLNRSITDAYGGKTLVSWSGTMFEYLMPLQVMKNFDETLLDTTYKSVVNAQIKYGNEKNIPWGISESAYYEFDINNIYQYKAFGVPGVGMKRGLEDELVVSPYSTIMALGIDKDSAIENIIRLKNEGFYGEYGLIEAIDYTPSKLKSDDDKKKVNCYMVHHLGMSLLALDNALNSNIIKELFHSIPEIKGAEILLKENTPDKVTFSKREYIKADRVEIEPEDFIPRVISEPLLENPEVLLLSNGDYSLMINQLGTGYSKVCNGGVYRWKGDTTSDPLGMLFYIRDKGSREIWSATYEPCKTYGNNYKAVLKIDGGEFTNSWDGIESISEIVISAEDTVEMRKIKIINKSDIVRRIDVTSYMEVILTPFEADVVHPAFSNLFIRTEFDSEYDGLIANRRPRVEGGTTNYVFHKVLGDINEYSYETSRELFIGRNGKLQNPRELSENEKLSNTTGVVLDPILSLQVDIVLKPGEEKELLYVTGFATKRSDLNKLMKKYSNGVDSIINEKRQYNLLTQLELKSIGIKSGQANVYQRLASYMLYLNLGRKNREEYIENIKMHQKDLWSYGISGDLPIILLVINDEDDISLVRQVINMHYYWRIKGIKSDLIIYNQEEFSYEEPLQKSLLDSIRKSMAKDNLNKSGGVFIYNKSTMSGEVRDFLNGIANISINSKNGTLFKQLEESQEKVISYIRHKELCNSKKIKAISRKLEENSHKLENKLGNEIISLNNCRKNRDNQLVRSDFNIEELDFYNGYGGFNRSNKSYIIRLNNNEKTPTPWINVISNENFGFHISEVGSSYTWCGNSRENKITPWNNDWVRDEAGEGLYIRDNSTKEVFSITPMPVRDCGEYIIEHGFGYSNYKHTAKEINGELTAFCPINENLKIYKITLENLQNISRELTIFYYAQLVLGVHNYQSAKYITTKLNKKYIWSQNSYSEHFGNIKGYLSILGGSEESFSGSRREFIGVGGTISSPEALNRDRLSNKVGSIYDPALIEATNITLHPNEKKELVIILGAEEGLEEINEKVEKYTNIKNVDSELENVKKYWNDILGKVEVETPDIALNYMLNGWLTYQTISCRYRARTAFYQSGGAYGFRDQLQDSMAIGILDPKVTKDQILISASRQYLEGDVQHWWHPIVNSGIRTRFSDDLLWLPYVTSDYIKSTGDYSILEEVANYLEDEPLRDGEDERYTIVNKSTKSGTIYEHCIKAINKSLKYGEHGIPLMGSGDWNDGMSTVGNKGRGESVWLGWFLYKILSDFKEISLYMKDNKTVESFNKNIEILREHLNSEGWDGKWYKRAFFDDGTPLGSIKNQECKIDAISQSWSVISGGGKKEYSKLAMDAVEEHLVREDSQSILLLTPAFDKSDISPGYIKGYVPGVRENGGQYTHAAVWSVLAFAQMGLEEKAVKYYDMINPINHSKTKDLADKYKVEPYVMTADIYENPQHKGRGGWSWYTGAAGWMYKVGIEDIIGLKKIKGNGYKIEPCIPSSWNEYKVRIKEENYEYHITVIREKEKGIFIDGKKIEGDIIPILKGKRNIVVKI